jgi:hypothetical protein
MSSSSSSSSSSSLRYFRCGIISGGKSHFEPAASGYIELHHEDEYGISISNLNEERASVEIQIDGREVGRWILKPFATVCIERPADVAKKFTFLRADTKEAAQAGIKQGANENGVIRIVCKVEKSIVSFIHATFESRRSGLPRSYSFSREPTYSCSATRSIENEDEAEEEAEEEVTRGSTLKSGATGLGAASDQRFTTAEAIKSFIENRTTHFVFRLACTTKTVYEPLHRPKTPPPVNDNA